MRIWRSAEHTPLWKKKNFLSTYQKFYLSIGHYERWITTDYQYICHIGPDKNYEDITNTPFAFIRINFNFPFWFVLYQGELDLNESSQDSLKYMSFCGVKKYQFLKLKKKTISQVINGAWSFKILRELGLQFLENLFNALLHGKSLLQLKICK